MSLKILIVPFSILLTLILIIGFIKPDIGALQEKKSMLLAKQDQSQSMTTLLDNIAVLTASLDSEPESERLLGSYIPRAMDQERAIDMLNYLAAQSGVTVSMVAMKNIDLKDIEVSVVDAVDSASAEEGDDMIPPVSKPQVKAFSATVTVGGEYASIKAFFQRLAHMNRFHEIESFSLAVPLDDSEEATPGFLKGILVSRFDYFPAQKLNSAINVPIFMKGAFDSAELSSLSTWISSPVSPLKQPAAGRPNPFQ